MSEAEYAAARERDQGRCQFPIEDGVTIAWRKCGQATTHAHHRQLRSQGGPDTAENLILLCPSHHSWCHDTGAGRRFARRTGLILGPGDSPARQEWMDDPIPEDGYVEDDDNLFFAFEGQPFTAHEASPFVW